MKLNRPDVPVRAFLKRAPTALFALALLCCVGAEALAQKTWKHTYPAKKNVRLQLSNLSGAITVEGWDRDEIKLVAEMEAPVANFTPRQEDDALIIDVKNQNRGRGDVGSINFKIWLPNSSVVDIETNQGNISVKDINGSMVRAHVWLSGDIELLNLATSNVMASNTTGNIIFDGLLAWGGKYEFKSTQGNINIRIPGDAAFLLNAVSPERNINLGGFDNGRLMRADPRKASGQIGANANASLTVSNQKGRIALIRR